MALHLIKLSVGTEDIEDLRNWQAGRLKRHKAIWHGTRMMPRRREEILQGGGSIYWVIRGVLQVRQRILDIESDHDEEGRAFARIVLDPELVPVVPRPHRPFQGWRYLDEKAAPLDLGRAEKGEGHLPPEMLAELRQLGIL